MDDDRFDALARRLTAATESRRTLLRLLAGSGLATVLGRGGASAEARSRPRRQRGRRTHRQPDLIAQDHGCRHAQARESGLLGKTCALRGPHSKPPCCAGSSCLKQLSDGTFQPVQGKQKGRCMCDDGYANLGGGGSCTKLPPEDQCVDFGGLCNVGRDICCGISGPNFACQSIDASKGPTQCPTAGGHTRCCKLEGVGCFDDCECCRALRCLLSPNGDRECQPPPNVCHAVGESCADGEPCCAGAGGCLGGRCCLPDTFLCSRYCAAEADCAVCCAGYCRGDGRCGPVQGCVAYAGECTSTEQCCNNVDCTFDSDGIGRCRYP